MSVLLNKQAEELKWLFIKLSFALFFYRYIYKILEEILSISSQKGLCNFINCDFITIDIFKSILLLVISFLLILYVLEKQMKYVTFFLFLSSFLVLSAHESFGVQNRTGILVLIWFVQFICYFRADQKPDFNLTENRIFYPVQVIVACYTLSSLSKLITSGFSWFTKTSTVALQLIKSQQTYILDGRNQIAASLDSKIALVTQHETLLAVLLFGALMIELTSGLALLNNKMRIIYGLLLFCLHLGISFLFSIKIEAFYFSMLIFMLNPIYHLYLLIDWIFQKIKLKKA